MSSEYARIIYSLVIVFGLIFVLLYCLKKFKLTRLVGNKHINIINSVSIGLKERIMLIEVNKVFLLIGSTPSHIETLYVFNELTPATAEEYTNIKSNFAEQMTKLTK